ncbi:MAG: hypothetical protein N3F05_05010, partial [Candidatus Diapherotrites archaeon]|nr:hypothetical protein [Candidatus Diapherotrites archaeon]
MFIKEKAARFISAIEDAKIPLYVWAIYFYGFAIARGLLEGLLEYHKTIPPAEALFLHFPLWYFNVFLSLSIIVSFFTGEKLWKTAKVIFLFTPLLLLVPVFDFLVSGGRGYMLGYAYDFESFSKVLLSVGGIIPGSLVSPGQSTLAWLAIFLISGYCFVKSVRIHKILLLVATIYLIICMYASVKFIVCLMARALSTECNYKVSSVLFLSAVAI